MEPKSRVFANGQVKPCCRDAANLELVPEESNAETGLTTRKCRVCGCRHRRLRLDPIKMKIIEVPKTAQG